MSAFTLPNGREIVLTEFSLKGTYAGQLEGSPATVTPSILKYEHSLAINGFRQIIEPQKPYDTLPRQQCFACFFSGQGTKTGDPDYASMLEVVWWVNSTGQSIDAMVDEILPKIDWETYAKDYDIMAF